MTARPEPHARSCALGVEAAKAFFTASPARFEFFGHHLGFQFTGGIAVVGHSLFGIDQDLVRRLDL